MQLSKNFTLQELTVTNKPIPNIPSSQEIGNLTQLAGILESVRYLCDGRPIKVNSAFRCPAVNSAVGGSATSAHLKGLAGDFTVVGLSLREVFDRIRKSNIIYDQLILEPSWVHLGLAAKPRQQNLIYDGVSYVTA